MLGIVFGVLVAMAAGIPSNCVGCSMSGLDLQGRDLRNVSWVGVDVRRANLRGVRTCNYAHGTPSGCARLDAATLRRFAHAELEGAQGP